MIANFTIIRTFKALEAQYRVREGMRTATRKVTNFYYGKPTVGFRGYRDFVVAYREIVAVNNQSVLEG